MAVTYIDPAAGALAQGVAEFGTGLALRATQKQRREQALRENPAQMQALAAAYRQAQAAGQGNSFLEGIGVRPEFGGQILAFQPNVQERTETAMLTQGTPEALVRAETGKATVEAETAENILQKRIIGFQTDNELMSAILSGRQLRAEDLAQIPEARVRTEGATLGAQEAEAGFTGSLFRRRTERGIDRLTVDAEELQAQAAMQGAKLDIRTAEAYSNYLDSLDPSSHEYQVALTGLRNPAQLAHIQFHENMSFEASLAKLRAAGTPADKLAETLKVQSAYQSALQTYRETIANDNIGGKEKEALVNQHADNLNAIRLIAEQLQTEGLIFPIDAAMSQLADKDRIDFISRQFKSQNSRDIFEAMVDEFHTRSSPAGDPLEQLQADQDFWNSLLQRDREQLESGWTNFKNEFKSWQEAEARAIRRERAVGTARGSVEALGRGFDPRGEDRIMSLYNNLSDEAKGYFNPPIPRRAGP